MDHPEFSQEHVFMREALKQAKMAAEIDEVPIGAVIVHEGQIIAKAHNQVEMLHDPTAHAEMIAMTQAANALSSKWLHPCTLYVTIEPCSMCAGAIVLARIKRLYYGAPDPKAGACGTVMNIVQNAQLNHQIEVYGRLLEKECGDLIRRFFQQRRSQQKSI
jgi:tRNA(adenine34) deaminase